MITWKTITNETTRIVDTYFLCIYSFIIFDPYNYFMNFCPYILQEMIYIRDFRGGKL